MKKRPVITSIELYEFLDTLKDVGIDPTGAIPTYMPGSSLPRKGAALRIYTDVGITGEYVGTANDTAHFSTYAKGMIGRNPLERETIYRELKLTLRQLGGVGMGMVDIALWDLAGKYHEAPVYELLGGSPKRKIRVYASTINGAVKGKLSTAESFADFAEQCLEMGYPGFKIHPWPAGPLQRHIDVVHAVGKRVGGRMDLMLDPFCYYQTFGEAVKVGRACDEEAFFWWEDPYADTGISQFGHRKLRQLVKTPLLQGEHIRRLEPHVDFALAEATDFVRADVVQDGITASMKIAHAAEGLGLDVEHHSPGPAQRHCIAATANSNYYEMAWVHPDVDLSRHVYASDYRDGLDAIDSEGCVPVPEGPGLGVTYDWALIEKTKTAHVRF